MQLLATLCKLAFALMTYRVAQHRHWQLHVKDHHHEHLLIKVWYKLQVDKLRKPFDCQYVQCMFAHIAISAVWFVTSSIYYVVTVATINRMLLLK